MYYNIFSGIIIALLSIFALYILLSVIINLLLGKRDKAITFLRNFKKGGYAIIYIISVPVFFMGYKYSGENILNSFFLAVKEIINLVVLKYDTKSINALMQANKLFRIAVYYDFTMVFINAVLFVSTLIGQYIWGAIESLIFNSGLYRRIVLFGYNDQNLQICASDKKYKKLLVDTLKDKQTEDLYFKKVPYKSVSNYLEAVKSLLNKAKTSKKEFVWIINTGSDDLNIQIARVLIKEIDLCSEKQKQTLYSYFKAYVFGSPIYMDIFEDIMSDSYGCITYYNKYQKMAIDFIDKYPFTKFMDSNQIDYSTTLIKKEVDINVLLIGFGDTNQQVFLTSVANNQFLTTGETDEPVLKEVNYYILDKEKDKSNKNLNHSYYRYETEKESFVKEDYLDLPNKPAHVEFLSFNINDKDYYTGIKNVLGKKPNDKNFIVVAFGYDLENIDMAQKLAEKTAEWGIECNIFAKATKYSLQQEICEKTKLFGKKVIRKVAREEGYYLFGNNKEVIYNLNNILCSEVYQMSQHRNFIYDVESAISKNNGEMISEEEYNKIITDAVETWHKRKKLLDRDSSLFACLSIRSKLNLMGLDYVKQSEPGKALTEEEYLEIYDDKKEIKFIKTPLKNKIEYDLNFPISKRGILGRHEHSRWNSFMISRGYIPASKKQILNEIIDGKHSNGKNVKLRTHGNITSFYGLVEYRQIIAHRDEKSEISKDVIKYDYQLLDDAYWLLTECGYKIIKK